MKTVPAYDRVKGIHPGEILKREIRKRNLKGVAFSASIGEHFQTINAITKGRRKMNAGLSIKLGQYFSIEKEYFMMLQAYYEVNETFRSKLNTAHPLKGKFRSSLFWDTKLEHIDIEQHKRSVIQRVLERGNQKEIKELINLYGLEIIRAEVDEIGESFVPKYARNIDQYINPKTLT